MTQKRIRRITARELFDGYPDSDLIGCPLPHKRETVKRFLNRTSRLNDCGDTLFAFLFRELEDCSVDRDECLRRVRAAIEDLEALHAALETGI